MKIRLEPQVAVALETCAVQVHGQEFSGFGMVRVDREAQEFVVYDFIHLDVGTAVYTEIVPAQLLKLINDGKTTDMRCWVHRHPLGDGHPGWHNWSSTDNATIDETPLGGIPELVGWSISIVRTPRGWVGRVDNHIKNTTEHLDVAGQASPDLIDEIDRIYDAYMSRKHRPFWAGAGQDDGNWTQEDLLIDPERSYPYTQDPLFDEEAWDETEGILMQTVTSYTGDLNTLEKQINAAASMDQFDDAYVEIDRTRDYMFETFGTPPPPLLKRLSALEVLLKARERVAMIDEEALA